MMLAAATSFQQVTTDYKWKKGKQVTMIEKHGKSFLASSPTD